jgi:drug/metabolite transporter (DMT)-like permease
MKKSSLTLCLILFGVVSAVAHPGHQSTPHIHLTESVSIGIAIVLAIVLSIIGFYLFRKYVNKRSHAN